MVQRIVFFLVLTAISACGGGGSGSVHFDSLAGRWQIDAQNLVDVNCPVIVGGLTAEIAVSIDGDVVTVQIEELPSLQFVGSATAGGFTTTAEASENGNSTTYQLSIENVPPTNDIGVARYSVDTTVDQEVVCRFTATGTAEHLSAAVQG